MKDLADLHIHTTASDGAWTPAKVVHAAAQIGLGAVGITDHDTVDGLDEAIEAGRATG
ncbi:MAG: PHP domain-containing protein, partial [Armatimonadetes bacterium]|nr:PHP domain-containing protein [Armatimonadota bacterium]